MLEIRRSEAVNTNSAWYWRHIRSPEVAATITETPPEFLKRILESLPPQDFRFGLSAILPSRPSVRYVEGWMYDNGFRLLLFDTHEPPMMGTVRPRIRGRVERLGPVSVVRYRLQVRFVPWLIFPAVFLIGLVASAVGLHGVLQGGSAGYHAALTAGIVPMLWGLLGGIFLPAGTEEYGIELESWLEQVLQSA
jgi:hypothetical protein